MSSLTHRGLRMAAFLAGLAIGLGTAVFAYSNTAHVSVSWWRLHWSGVPLGLLALVPLLAGLVAGYLYHLPARMYHLREHMRHRSLVHHLEKQNRELQHSLDQLLQMPETDVPASRLPASPAAPVSVLAQPGAGAGAVAKPVLLEIQPAARTAARKSAPGTEGRAARGAVQLKKSSSARAADSA